MATGDGLYHYYRSWYDDPTIPYASIVGYVRALNAGEETERPTEEVERERDRLAEEYGALLDEDARSDVHRAARPVAHGLPVRRGAQVLLRLLVPDALVEQAARVRRPARAPRLPRGRRGHLPPRPPRGGDGARRAAAHVGDRRRAARAGALAADRRAAEGAARAARRLDAAAGARRRAGRDHRPDVDHALGRHDRARPGVGARRGGRRTPDRRRRVAGHGRRARRAS